MTTRFSDNGNYGENPADYLFSSNLKRATQSPRGHAALAELEEALLAMPVRRLIAGALVQRTEEGFECCAVGALACHRLRRDGVLKLAKTRWGTEAKELRSESELENLTAYYDDASDTQEFGQRMGLAESLAWKIANINDEVFDDKHCTPEQRWGGVLARVQAMLGKERHE